jgi:hypothetical protein
MRVPRASPKCGILATVWISTAHCEQHVDNLNGKHLERETLESSGLLNVWLTEQPKCSIIDT